jgi:hypothetical protein
MEQSSTRQRELDVSEEFRAEALKEVLSTVRLREQELIMSSWQFYKKEVEGLKFEYQSFLEHQVSVSRKTTFTLRAGNDGLLLYENQTTSERHMITGGNADDISPGQYILCVYGPK